MKFDTFDLIRIFTSLQLILLCVALLVRKTKGNQHKLLALFLFSLSSFIICGICARIFDHFTKENLDFILYIIFSFNFLIGPSFYFYIKSKVTGMHGFGSNDMVHLLPFMVVVVFNPLYFHIPGSDIILFSKSFIADSYFVTVISCLHLQILIYLFFALLCIKKHRQSFDVGNKSKNQELRLYWMKFLVYSLFVIWVLESLIYFTNVYFQESLCHIKIVLAGLNFGLANLIVIFGLKKPELFYIESNRNKYNKNIIKEKEKRVFLSKLEQYIRTESPYLNPKLSLSSMAKELNITPHQLSQLLNTVLNTNFYDYINSYRIEEAKKLLLSYNSQEKTILEILYDVGFSSKSVFNTAFKKHTGVTPTTFRNQKSKYSLSFNG